MKKLDETLQDKVLARYERATFKDLTQINKKEQDSFDKLHEQELDLRQKEYSLRLLQVNDLKQEYSKIPLDEKIANRIAPLKDKISEQRQQLAKKIQMK